MTTKTVSSRAPGKIILSGEHAVVHGCPALAIPIHCYNETTLSVNDLPTALFELDNLNYKKAITLAALHELKQTIDKRYNEFLSGKKAISHVLQHQEELSHYTLARVIERLSSKHIEGVSIKQTSNIPIGCGLGSSAAMIVSQLRALQDYFNVTIERDTFFNLAKEIEDKQHGHSSGLDIAVAMDETCCYFNESEFHTHPHISHPFFVIHAGKPLSHTGECVAHTAPFFKDEGLKKEFTMTTNALHDALTKNDASALKHAIQHNHYLLRHIGVVPENVHQFIKKIEARNGAAKICGAGSIQGENAGMVLVTCDENFTDLLDTFGLTLFSKLGTHNDTATNI